MDNTEKLIRAWLKCEGYEIEEVETKGMYNHPVLAGPIERVEIDYKVTKKELKGSFMSEMIAHDEAWSAIVQYVTSHSDDIQGGIDDFDSLGPVLNFFNRHVSTDDLKMYFKSYNFGECEVQ